MHKMAIMVLFALLHLLSVVPALSDDQQKTYLFAVLPQRPPVTMHANWRPFLDQLEKATGVQFKLKLYETMPQFETEMLRGEADLIFSTPPHTVLARQSQKYQPLVRGSHQIAGVLFTRRDSAIKTLKDLDNQEVAFVGSRNV